MKWQLMGVAFLLAGGFAVLIVAQDAPTRTPEQEEQVAKVREILEVARQAAFTMPSERNQERLILLQGIAVAFAEAGDVDSAMVMVGALESEYPQRNANVLGLVALAQARSGDVNAALNTLSSVEHEPLRSMTLAHVVAELARGGYWGAAKQFVEQIQSPDLRDQALSGLAFRQLSAGDVSGARLTAGQIVGEESKERVLSTIAQIEALPPGKRELRMSVGQFPAVTLGRRGVRPETAPFRMWLPTAGVLVAADNSEDPGVLEVRKTVRQALENKGEDREQAIARLQNAARLAQSLQELTDRLDSLWLVSAALADLGETERARETAGLLFAEGVDETKMTPARLVFILNIAMTQGAAGDVEGAVQWANDQVDPVLRTGALLGVAQGTLRRLEMDSWPAYMHEHMRNEQR